MQTKGILGLSLDEEQGLVTREGYPGPVKIRRRVLCGLLKLLLACSGRLCTLHAMREAWPEFGRAEVPEYKTIVGTISRLEDQLESLGVEILNERHYGWYLAEIDEHKDMRTPES